VQDVQGVACDTDGAAAEKATSDSKGIRRAGGTPCHASLARAKAA
jgi:hypothetical protein